MKVPKYILRINNTGKRGGELLYNTITGGKVLITNKQLDLINGNREDDRLSGLFSKQYIVDDNFNDEEYINEKLSYMSDCYNLTLINTYNCNMSCEYCFEGNVKKLNESMKSNEAEVIINRIIGKIVNENKKKINIAFTGGEPLLNFEFIDTFFDLFEREILSKYDIEYNCSLISNGTLINDYMINKLKRMHCTGIQVTIDGTEADHNLSRPLKNKGNSFEKIIENINKYYDDIPFVIRSNYKPGEENKLYKLVDELLNRIDEKRKIKLKLRNIMNTTECVTSTKSIDYDELIQVLEYSFNKGVDIVQGTICDNCRVYSSNNEYIVPNGDIYRCFMFVGHTDHVVGNIFTENYEEKQKLFNNLKIWKSCVKCSIVSLCMGGCRYEAYSNTGDITNKICEFDEKKKLINRYFQLKYKI